MVSAESLVDRARSSDEARERRHWCTMLAQSSDARSELSLMDAFDEETTVTGRSHGLRVELAVEGALATLDDEP